MSRALQDFSFLNRWFIFRRRSQGTVVSGAPNLESAPEVFELPPKAPSRIVVPALPGAVSVKPMADKVVVDEALALSPAPVPDLAPAPAPAEAKAVGDPVGGRPIYKFFHSAILKDDLGTGRKDWARYISSFTYSQLRDLDDPTVIYPTLEAAFAAERFKKGTDQPQLGPKLFSSDENLHQKYLKQMAGVNDKRKYELLEDEGSEVRELLKPGSMKKVGAKWNETKWLEARDAVMANYIRQRYETDAEFKRILDLVKAKNGLLVFYNGTRPSEMGGLVKEGGVIDGQNKLGQMYMSVIT